MPDIAICNSTVCSVQYKCARNWNSNVHQPDRDPKDQEWVPLNKVDGESQGLAGGVGYFEGCKASDCSYWMPMNDQVDELPENFTYAEMVSGLPYKRVNGIIDRTSK